MNRLKALFVWISRIGYSRGFGIQSPTDYWFVRYVINEHWPYYEYSNVGTDDGWMRRKVGRLYFRLANWRQPGVITADDYQEYFRAGCKKAAFGLSNELMLLSLGGDWRSRFDVFCQGADDSSVLVVESVCENKEAWREIVSSSAVTISYDLYYCGIVMFDKKRTKKHYIINF